LPAFRFRAPVACLRGEALALLVVGPHEFGEHVGVAKLGAERVQNGLLDPVKDERLRVRTRSALVVAGAAHPTKPALLAAIG